jgi:hypothetical protein
MRQEVLEQVAALLAGELGSEGDDLDSLEDQVTQAIRQIGQRALQVKLEGKKGGTQEAGSPAGAARRPAS